MACNPSKNHMEIYKIGDKFMKHPSVKKVFDNPSDLVVKKFIQLFGFQPSEYRVFEPSKNDIQLFKGEMKHILKQIKKGRIAGLTGSNLYTTSAVVRRNPQLAALYDEFLRINYELKGRQGFDNEKFSTMMNYLAEAGTIEGLLPKAKAIKKAQRLAMKYQQEIESLRIEADNGIDVAKKLSKAEANLDKFLNEGEGAVFKKFIEAVESKTKGIRSIPEIQELMKEISKRKKGRVLTEKDMKKIKDSIHNSGIVDTPQMENALTEYVSVMHNAYSTLELGVNAYISAIKEGMMAKGVSNFAKLNQVEVKLKEKLLPDEKVGYFPHFRYDLNTEFLDGLMPKLQKLSIDSNIGLEFEGGIIKAVNSVDLFEAAVGDINTYVSKRIKPRTKDLNDKAYSMNFPVVVKRYLDEVNRFNFIAHTQKVTRKTLNEASRAFKKGKDLEGYGRQFVEMVMEMHHAQTGTKEITNPEWNNLSRALLNMEFISKLGLNIRSGAKNATQYLLNLVEFGPIMMLKSRSWYGNDPTLKKYVEESMRESGLLFSTDNPELLDLQGSKAFKQNIRLNDNNEIEFTKPSKLSAFADMTGRAAGHTGVFMRFAENINREGTYKLGFYKMWKSLESNANFKKMVNEKHDGKMSQKQWEQELKFRSGNYAQNMVNLLHFDYSSVSKSKIMRSGVGRFMFQFQHYAHKFAEYNFKLMREAKYDLYADPTNIIPGFSQNIGKAYRMGLTYFLAPAIASAMFDRDFFRLIEHDTFQRIGQWWTFFTGDEDEIKKASYGRGAIGALLGAPILSDALTIAEVLELYQLDDDSRLKMMTGFNDLSRMTTDQKIHKAASTLSVAGSRFFYKTSDMAFSGYPERALGYELNFFPTKRSKKLQQTAIDYTPDTILKALDSIKDFQESGRRKSSSPSSKSKKTKKVSALY